MQARRMTSLAKYADDLAVNKDEVRALYDDLLINVTEFFRDPESFRSLARRVFPAMLAGRTEGAPLRIWVPGCSTGEEAYSIAIALTEYRARAGKSGPEQFSTQIFGTDISERAIQTARAGRYPAHIAERMSKERLLRFFDKVDGGYKVKKAIRDQCLFSRHDLTSDPPFARLDLISCRNVLIYFAKNLQLRVFPLFHYALRPGGFLWLGKSENPGELSKLFQVVDKTHKIYAKSASSPSVRLPLPAKALREPPAGARPGATSAKAVVDVRQYADKLVLAKFSLPGVIVSDDLEILQFRGRAFPYLEATPGQPSLNLLKMARPELLAGLRSALQAAKKENRTQSKKGLRLDVDGESIDVDIDVLPLNSLAEAKDRAFLVLFKGAPSSKGAARGANAGRAAERDRKGDGRVEELLAELAEIKDYHQSLIEQYEVAQAELTSTNEELQSANEELLSANEEIETSKEELQSSNEELITVNDELQLRNSDLTVLGGNLNNLLAGVDIPVLIVGGDYRLKLFSPKAGQMLGLSEASVGLAIAEVATRFRVSWRDLIDEVGRSGCSTEVELRDRDGSWWRAQVRPFRTAEQRIEGATIALVDIDALKQNELRLRAALEYISSVEKCMPIPLVVVSRKCQFRSANPAFSEAFCGSKGLVGEDIFTILEMSEADVANVRALVARAIQENASFKDVEIECKSSLRGPRKALLSIGKVPWQGPEAEAALISFVDVTEQRRMVDERQLLLARERDARLLADEANRAKDVFLATLSHELRTPLSSILTWAQLISRGRVDFEKARQGAAIIEQSARTQGKLIDDLLDVSRAISGKLAIEMRPVDPAAIVRLAIESVQPMADKKAVKIEESLAGQPVTILADPVRLQQILWNILANAVKFSPQAGAIQVALEKVGSGKAAALEIRVSDHGKGIPEKFLGEIFLPFSQADGMSTRVHGGLGLGLSIARSLAELQHGTVRAANAKGGGAVFTVSFPLAPEALARPRAAPLGSSADIATASGESDGSEPRLDGIKALFVDDDANMREAIGLAIVSLGAEVTAVASADEALATFVSGKWDVLLSDIAMPEQDGYALIQRVRALEIERGGCIPSIAITAYATANDARRALASGFHAHIAKPVGAVELGRLILQVIAQVARPALKSES
jgi:two-component system CheB/CheR fusion protein